MNNKELYYTICRDLDYLTKKYNSEELKILIKSLKCSLESENKENEE